MFIQPAARAQGVRESIFSTITAEASRHDAINLGQGFPDSDGPQAMLEKACVALTSGRNQYPPAGGISELKSAVAAFRESSYGLRIPPSNVYATVGATEAIAASVLAFVNPGDEVIVLEPFYDSYGAAISLAGGSRVSVPLKQVGRSWDIDIIAVEAALSPETAMVIVNNPHNPTGSVFSRSALQSLGELLDGTRTVVLADEVYETLTHGVEFTPAASISSLAERTITVSSAAKMLNVTGWKVGWVIAPEELLAPIAGVSQYLTFASGAPLQPAVAYALNNERGWIEKNQLTLQQRRDELTRTLSQAGWEVFDSPGTFFVCARLPESVATRDAAQWCMSAPEEIGVAGIPVSAFCDNPEPWSDMVRFAYCKSEDVIAEACRRLSA
ncbi:aminotransferase [Corynebacterium renale]|uniref:aminotransferase class I/II-fold pyridoxal phosphate-dependent enzyme n=1 Tax=Corynebacterium renale TaxID=1724 RepID=UPI000DA3A97C|nr:aminotransferase class I/II-fold pyridoxal phosphate-dependent enzyme [Corynebacterium renale]SQG64242.1 aminotransferase [Corynebacterium renale]STC94697.1 aminotransferase [Corynebacterium renale]